MEYFPSQLSRDESDALAKKIQSRIDENGWGLWAVEILSTGEFVGFVGLNQPQMDLPFSPCTEVGWRLAQQYWGRGFATEAGQCAIDFAFNNLRLNEVVSFTVVRNRRSRAVMERLGLTNTNEDFLHPSVSGSSGLQEHVLYKITQEQWVDAR
jgi:RimJ/RimL family protein N-acetyltransferase